MTTEETRAELNKLIQIRDRKNELLQESKDMRKVVCANKYHVEVETLSKQIAHLELVLSIDPNQLSMF